MASNCFLKIDGIDGDSRDEKHKGWVEVDGFSNSVSNMSQMGSGKGGSGAIRPDFQDSTFTKTCDKSSPNFAAFCAGGKHIPEIKVEFCATYNDEQKVYLAYKFNDCLISSASMSGMQDQQPVESVSFNYAKIEWKYTSFDDKGGSAGDTIKSHDLAINKGA